MKKIVALFATLLVLAGCTPAGGTPNPQIDQGAPTFQTDLKQIEVRFNAGRGDLPAELWIVGAATAIDKQGKVMQGEDVKTGQKYEMVTPFRIRTQSDGEAYVRIGYTPGMTAVLKFSAHLQGNGGDSMIMEITSGETGRLIPLGADAIEYCQIKKPRNQMGTCTVSADLLLLV